MFKRSFLSTSFHLMNKLNKIFFLILIKFNNVCSGVGLHDMRKIYNCDYFDCNCDMIHNIGRNDHFCIIILIFTEK